MRALGIFPLYRRIASINKPGYFTNGLFDPSRYFKVEEVNTIELLDGSLLIHAKEHLDSGSAAFSFEDHDTRHIIFGRAVYIPKVQKGEVQFWRCQVDDVVSFYSVAFSITIKTRILRGETMIYPDEEILGKPVYRISNKAQSGMRIYSPIGYGTRKVMTRRVIRYGFNRNR